MEEIVVIKESYEGGLESLKDISDAIHEHEAVGLWWANAVLRANFDNGESDPTRRRQIQLMTSLIFDDTRNDTEATVGGFAEALSDLSSEHMIDDIRVDYDAPSVLLDAAKLANMPANGMATFPWKSYTSIRDNVVYAREGYTGEEQQIWPPVERIE